MRLSWRIWLWRHAPAGWAVAGVATVLVAARIVAPAPPRTVPVVVAAHPLAAGETLVAADLRVARLAAGTAPVGAADDVADLVGAVPAVALPAGLPVVPEVLDAARFEVEPPAGTSVVPLELVGSEVLRVGDDVDVVAAGCEAEPVRGLVVGLPDGGDLRAPVLLAVEAPDAVRIVGYREVCTLAAVLVE